jgi:hypothetical protein
MIEIRGRRIAGRKKNLEARRRREFIDGWESGGERRGAEEGGSGGVVIPNPATARYCTRLASGLHSTFSS